MFWDAVKLETIWSFFILFLKYFKWQRSSVWCRTDYPPCRGRKLLFPTSTQLRSCSALCEHQTLLILLVCFYSWFWLLSSNAHADHHSAKYVMGRIRKNPEFIVLSSPVLSSELELLCLLWEIISASRTHGVCWSPPASPFLRGGLETLSWQ